MTLFDVLAGCWRESNTETSLETTRITQGQAAVHKWRLVRGGGGSGSPSLGLYLMGLCFGPFLQPLEHTLVAFDDAVFFDIELLDFGSCDGHAKSHLQHATPWRQRRAGHPPEHCQGKGKQRKEDKAAVGVRRPTCSQPLAPPGAGQRPRRATLE